MTDPRREEKLARDAREAEWARTRREAFPLTEYERQRVAALATDAIWIEGLLYGRTPHERLVQPARDERAKARRKESRHAA